MGFGREPERLSTYLMPAGQCAATLFHLFLYYHSLANCRIIACRYNMELRRRLILFVQAACVISSALMQSVPFQPDVSSVTGFRPLQGESKVRFPFRI